jgi:hypothetical protein
MSNSNASQLNVSNSNIAGKCDLKCAYNFKYTATGLIATNEGASIYVKMDVQKTPPVTYNTESYNASFFNIVSPSANLYNGKQTQGEINIFHTPSSTTASTNYFVVTIPLYESTNSNSATNLLTQIITNVASSAPSTGEQTTININDFTLQNIVPSKPFYSYLDNKISLVPHSSNLLSC